MLLAETFYGWEGDRDSCPNEDRHRDAQSIFCLDTAVRLNTFSDKEGVKRAWAWMTRVSIAKRWKLYEDDPYTHIKCLAMYLMILENDSAESQEVYFQLAALLKQLGAVETGRPRKG